MTQRSLLCSASSQIPTLSARIREHLALDLNLRALELHFFLLIQEMVTAYHISLLSLTCGCKYFQTWIMYSRDTQCPVEKLRNFKMPLDVKLKGLVPGFWLLKWVLPQGARKGCAKNNNVAFSENHYTWHDHCHGVILTIFSSSWSSPAMGSTWKSGYGGHFHPNFLFFWSIPCHVVVLVAVVIDLCLMSSHYWLRFFWGESGMFHLVAHMEIVPSRSPPD